MSGQKIETTDLRLSTGEKGLTSKLASPLHEPYLQLKEAQGAEVLVASAHSLPLPLHPVPHTATATNNTFQIWGDPSKWRSGVPLRSLTGSWNQHDAVVRSTSSSFATQDRGQLAISVPDAEPSFPIISEQSTAIGHHGNDIGRDGKRDDAGPLSNKPLGEWQTHSSPLSAPPPSPFPGFLSHPSMSYTDAYTHTHSHTQSTNLIEPFSPGNNVVDSNAGPIRADFGVASTSFEPPLVDVPGMPLLLHGKLHVPEADNLGPAFKFPPTQYYPGPASNPNNAFEEHDPPFFSHHEPWYETEAPERSPGVAPITHPHPHLHRSSPTDEPRFEGDNGLFTAAGPSSHSRRTILGGRRPGRHRRSRGQLLPKDREETSKTRKWKACIRCRMQKIRCVADPGQPETESCQGCRKVLVLETKKVIHRIPCLRWNLSDVVPFRVGCLGFTQRWAGVCVEDIPSNDWADERVVTIGLGVTKLLCEPIPVRVRRFKPNSTDIQHRYWKYEEAQPSLVITLPAYALADVNATSEEYRRYVKRNAEEAVRRFISDTTVDDIVRRTFSIAIHHGAKAVHKEFGKIKGDPATLFRNYFRLWFASRFTLGSAYIADGHEKLEGATPTCVYPGKQFVSRMITAQFDSIGYSHVLANLRREVLEDLWLLVQKRTDTTFFTVYLIVFMMLHEVSVACQDRRRRAKEQGLESYYDLEDVTAEIKRGADVILAHWHYYKGDLDPLVMSEARMTQAFGADSTEEIRVLMATCQKYEQRRKSLQNEATMEDDPLYLVSQMFERNWRPAHGS